MKHDFLINNVLLIFFILLKSLILERHIAGLQYGCGYHFNPEIEQDNMEFDNICVFNSIADKID